MDNNNLYGEWFEFAKRDFETIGDECIELVPYGVQVRYPYQLDVSNDDTIVAINCAEKIENFVRGKIGN